MLLCRGTANALATSLITAVTRRWGKKHTDLVVQTVLHMNMAKILYVSEMSLYNKYVPLYPWVGKCWGRCVWAGVSRLQWCWRTSSAAWFQHKVLRQKKGGGGNAVGAPQRKADRPAKGPLHGENQEPTSPAALPLTKVNH